MRGWWWRNSGRRRGMAQLGFVVVAALAGACSQASHGSMTGGAGNTPATGGGAPAASSTSSPGAASTAGANASAEPTKIDMDAIFPPGPGRDIVLNACQNCHTFVPIVVLQMNEAAWTRNSRDHRMRVSSMSDADFATAYEYLKKNFNPDRPVPKLPPELLASWTTS